ncbi:hypothetical protein ACFS3C_14795 [Azotobacter vinelandii]
MSIEGSGIDPALAVAVIPNAAMAHVALTQVAHLAQGESVLVHDALGGFAAAFPGIAKQIGASRVVGTVRTDKLSVAAKTKLPYDRIVDSDALLGTLGDERFDVVIDPVGGAVRSHSFALMKPGSRLIVAGNASGDWGAPSEDQRPVAGQCHRVRLQCWRLSSVSSAGAASRA